MTCVGPVDLILYLVKSGHCTEFLSQTFLAQGFPAWKDYLGAFGLTLLLETPLYFLFLKKAIPARRTLLASLVVNLLTHPAVWFFWPRILADSSFTIGNTIWICEIFALTVEMLVLRYAFRIPFKRAFYASFTANLFSWWIGILILAP